MDEENVMEIADIKELAELIQDMPDDVVLNMEFGEECPDERRESV